MKSLVIIGSCLALAIVFKVVEYLTCGNTRSVGAKANKKFKTIAKVDINDKEALKEAMEHYNDLID